jgi:hypothetical protein
VFRCVCNEGDEAQLRQPQHSTARQRNMQDSASSSFDASTSRDLNIMALSLQKLSRNIRLKLR